MSKSYIEKLYHFKIKCLVSANTHFHVYDIIFCDVFSVMFKFLHDSHKNMKSVTKFILHKKDR